MARAPIYRRALAAALLTPLLVSAAHVHRAAASERVQFDSAAVKATMSEFQRRRAEAAGQKIEATPGDAIEGYVVKPAGTGPFPVVVYLHDCSGLSAEVKANTFDPAKEAVSESVTSPDALLASRLVSWGYAVVMPDSFTTRNVAETCTTKNRPKQLWDAFGALAHAQAQPWADAKRIGLLGVSSGYAWHVARASDPEIVVAPPESFKAIVALLYHANCGAGTKMLAPMLVINGGVLEPEKCTVSVKEATAGGPPVTYTPVAGAYGSFITSAGALDQDTFKAWLGTTEAKKTVEVVRSFLDQHVKGAASN